MGSSYKLPEDFDASDVVDLTPETVLNAELKPTSLVTCINRGPKELRDQFDAQPYIIPPFAKFRCEYQVAKHLQRRNIVPGTRNPNPSDSSAPQFVPWIAIVGLDPSHEPFTAEELERFGESVEGLARDMLPTAAGKNVTVAKTADLRRTLPGHGVAGSEGVVSGLPDQQVFAKDDAARAAALAPVGQGESMASQDAAAAIAAGHVPADNVEQTSAPAPVGVERKGRRR